MITKKIFIFAGEESGDIRGAELIRKLRERQPDIVIDAAGGEQMRQAGANIIFDITHLAVVGFVEVLKHYGEFRKLMSDVVRTLSQNEYHALILIDYPGFNLRLARRIKHLNLPVIYYISPQVWAWGAKRSQEIAGLVDRMIVLFEFEKDIYKPFGLDTDFIGHPMVDMVAQYKPVDLKKTYEIPEHGLLVGFLPGSRVREVEKILPSMLDAMELYQQDKKNPAPAFIVSAARKDLEDIIQNELRERTSLKNIIVYSGNVSDIMASSDILIVASGTATLQSSLFTKPMVVVYKVAFLTWAMARILVKIPCIGMVNIVYGKKKIPELVQWDLTGERIREEIERYIQDQSYRQDIIEALKTVKVRLGPGGAAGKAAESVLGFLEERKEETKS